MPFEFSTFEVSGPVLVTPTVFGDNRGFFVELYKRSEYVAGGIDDYFVQDNFSRSTRGVLRGLHYQKPPKAQGKLVSCLYGAIYDIAVDIRKGSPTFGRWIGVELSEQNRRQLYVPVGFAHGFQVLSDIADVMYKCTDEYAPEQDRGIAWNDPEINVAWPLADPTFSAKDLRHPLLRDADNPFTY